MKFFLPPVKLCYLHIRGFARTATICYMMTDLSTALPTPQPQWATLTFDLAFAKPFAELKFGLSTDLSQKVK